MTFFYKRLFPCLWFGFIALWTIGALAAIVAKGEPPFPLVLMIVVPVILAVFGYILMRALVFDLVDAVYLDHGCILVANRSAKQQIALRDVINVNNTYLVNPERITLTLRHPGPLGREVTFMAPVRLWPFGRHALAEELTVLVANERDASPLNDVAELRTR
jgi:hypothetical protein